MYPGLFNLIALGGIAGTPAAPLHYKIDLKFTQTVDYTQLGGPLQENGATVTAFVTLTQRDTVGGQVAQFVFDSVLVGSNPLQMPANMMGTEAAAKGVIYQAMITNGRSAGGFKTTQSQPMASLFSSSLEAIFSGFRTTTKAGDTWADTVMTKDTIPVVREGTTMLSWQAAGVADGTVTLEGALTGTTRTVQKSGDQSLTSQYQITGTRHLTGTPGGTAITGTTTSKATITVTTESGDTFPVRTEHLATITRIE